MRSRIWNRLLAAVFALACAAQAAASDFYANYTKLDYTQPATPELARRDPVNAANVFSGGRPDPADAVVRPFSPGLIRWGKYADLVVSVSEGRRLVFSRATDICPIFRRPGADSRSGRWPSAARTRCASVRTSGWSKTCPRGSSFTGGMFRNRQGS